MHSSSPIPPAQRTLSKYYKISTPEYIEFRFELAGIFRRSLALLLDSLVCAALLLLCFLLVLLVFQIPAVGETLGPLSFLFLIFAFFFVKVGYMWALEWFFGGKTLGKYVMHIRVIQKTGVRLGGMQAFLRNLVRPVDSAPWFLNAFSCYFVGAGFALFSNTQQRLGDFLAHTLVVYERPVRLPPPIQLTREEERFWSNRKYENCLHSLTPEERHLLLQSSLQREELSLEARLRVFRALSQHLQREFGLQKPNNLSDEKWVLSAVSKLLPPPPAKENSSP
ncbi:MAG: RDD family protein [Proteobacteria bacterium]|nr:RDD family protein [Cystobacterineae bacterium]MCL2259617.1 RDD family protein [Cystobacterineae bacterium]MCL2313861.1 RDD family protein [Pseudomonadota bacterium]